MLNANNKLTAFQLIDRTKKFQAGEGRNGVFEKCATFQFIEIPSPVKVIGKDAFQNPNMRTVTFASKFWMIEIGAFTSCQHISSVELPPSLSHLYSNILYETVILLCQKVGEI